MKQSVYTRGAFARAAVRYFFVLAATSSLALMAIASDPAAASRRERGEAAAREAAETKPVLPKGPLTVIVSTDRQRVSVWSADGKVVEAPVSTGRTGYETPHGIFSVLGKETMHYSNLYDDAPMPFMQRLTWSGVALHAGNLPGYPASHGCVRLNHGFSQKLFGLTSVGTRVLVVDEDVTPQPISHPRLFTPLPSGPIVTGRAEPAEPGFVVPSRLGGPVAETTVGIMEQTSATTTVASTSDAVPPARRSRDVIASERAAALASAAANAKVAEARVKELAPAAKTAAVAAFEAMKALRVAHIARDRLAGDVKRVEDRIAAAKAELRGLERLRERTGNDAAIEKAALREAAIEERLASLSDELAAAQAAVAAHAATLAEATQRSQQLEREKAGAAGALKGALEAQAVSKTRVEQLTREQANRNKPITVLISRKTGKLSVRQGFEDIFETAVEIANRDAPLGTHLYTASAKPGSSDELRWHVVTLQGGREAPLRSRKSRRAVHVEATAVALEPTTALRALDRINIPAEAQEKVAELVKPGSSLIITDNGPSRETGKGTDFIVLTRQ